MNKSISRGVFALLCMTCFLSCSNMIEWVEFHHNADIKNIEASAGRVRVRSGGDSPYSLALLPSDTEAHLRVTPENPDATMAIRVDGGDFVDLPAGTYSSNVAPDTASHVADIRVTSPSGKTVKTYAVRVGQGETVRANRFAVWGYCSGTVGGTVQLRITSMDRSIAFVTSSVSASAFLDGSPQWVYFSFPETEFYRGMEYRFGLYHDQAVEWDMGPHITIPFAVGTDFNHNLLHDDVSISSYYHTNSMVWAIYADEWLDPMTFEVPW